MCENKDLLAAINNLTATLQGAGKGGGSALSTAGLLVPQGKKLVGFYSSFETLADSAQRLKDHRCDAITLYVSNTLFDPSDTFKPPSAGDVAPYYESNRELYWGFNQVCVNQIFPASGPQYYIGVTNSQDIWVKCSSKSPAGVEAQISYNLYRFVDLDYKGDY